MMIYHYFRFGASSANNLRQTVAGNGTARVLDLNSLPTGRV